MSTPLKQFKEREQFIHEQLFKNISLLTHIYPTSKDFDAVFKNDMFLKNNKAAFHHVVYYLLNILNPELTKEKITSWPLYDVKLENKFRSEVLVYINELNSIYPEANIPNIMASQLISPSGFRFVKFMLKLSQLVLLEHLKKNENYKTELLTGIKPHKKTAITNVITKNLQLKTSAVESETKQKYENFFQNYEKAIEKANITVCDQMSLNENLPKRNNIHKTKTRLFSQETYTEVEELITEKLNKLNTEMEDMRNVKNLCNKANELITYLLSDCSILEFNEQEFIVPKSGSYSVKNENNLSLHCLFNNFDALLKKENLEIPLYSLQQLKEISNVIIEMKEKYSHLNKRVVKNNHRLLEVLDIRPENTKPVIEKNIRTRLYDRLDGSLASPLEDSIN